MRVPPRIEARLAALESRVEPPREPVDEAEARESWELLQDVLEDIGGKREPMPADWLTGPRVQLSQEARDQLAEICEELCLPLGNDE